MKEEEINAIEETLNGMTFIKDVDDVVDYLETLGEVHFCDEGIDDGIDDEDCEDEYVMYRSYDLDDLHIILYYGNNSYLFTAFETYD